MKKSVSFLLIIVVISTFISGVSADTYDVTFPGGIKFFDTVEEVKAKSSITKVKVGADYEVYKTPVGTVAGFDDSFIEYRFEKRDGKSVLVETRYHFNGDDFGNDTAMNEAWISLVRSILKKYSDNYSVGYYSHLTGLSNRIGFVNGKHFIIKGPAALEA